MRPPFTRPPRAGYGPWLVALAALLCSVAALAVVLTRSSTHTSSVDSVRLTTALPLDSDCIDGVVVPRARADAGGTGKRQTASGGTLDELRSRVRVIPAVSLAGRLCTVQVLDSARDCEASIVASAATPTGATRHAGGPTRQGYGETGAGAILVAGRTRAGRLGEASGGSRSELVLVDSPSRGAFAAPHTTAGLVAHACPWRDGTRSAAVVVAGVDPSGLRAVATSMSARDLSLLGGLLLALLGVSLMMSRRRRTP